MVPPWDQRRCSCNPQDPHLARRRRPLWDLHCGWPAGPPQWRWPACRTLVEPSGNPRSCQSDNIRPEDTTRPTVTCQYRNVFFHDRDVSLRHCHHASIVQTLRSPHLLLTSRCVLFVSHLNHFSLCVQSVCDAEWLSLLVFPSSFFPPETKVWLLHTLIRGL